MNEMPGLPILGLFSWDTLEPMIFSLGPCDQREDVERMIEEGGGILQNPKINDKTGHRINLVERSDNRVNLHHVEDADLFDVAFIKDSYQANSIQLLANYRLNKETMFNYNDSSDLTSILYGIKKWADFLPEPKKKRRGQPQDEYSGESCSDIDEMISESAINQRGVLLVNKVRADYTKPEQKEIVAYLVEKRAYSHIKGNAIWQQMWKDQICNQRHTWQSLKEHFRKQIFPQLNSFSITPKQLENFRRSWQGLLITESEESEEEDEPVVRQKPKRILNILSEDEDSDEPPTVESSPEIYLPSNSTTSKAAIIERLRSPRIVARPTTSTNTKAVFPNVLISPSKQKLPVTSETQEEQPESIVRTTPTVSLNTTDLSACVTSEFQISRSPESRDENLPKSTTPTSVQSSQEMVSPSILDESSHSTSRKNQGRKKGFRGNLGPSQRFRLFNEPTDQNTFISEQSEREHRLEELVGKDALAMPPDELAISAKKEKGKQKIVKSPLKLMAGDPKLLQTQRVVLERLPLPVELIEQVSKEARRRLIIDEQDNSLVVLDESDNSCCQRQEQNVVAATDLVVESAKNVVNLAGPSGNDASKNAAFNNFEMPFSRSEEEQIVEYIVANDYASEIHGTALWKLIRSEEVISNRRFELVKEHFLNRILNNLESFGLKPEQIQKFQEIPASSLCSSSASFVESVNPVQIPTKIFYAPKAPTDGTGSRLSKNYSQSEDEQILRYIAQNKRFDEVGGIKLWKIMEERQVVANRTAQSMKERFRKTLAPSLPKYSACLQSDDILAFKKQLTHLKKMASKKKRKQ